MFAATRWKLICALPFIRQKDRIEKMLVFSTGTDKTTAELIRRSVEVVKRSSSPRCDWMAKINANISFVFVQDTVEKTAIIHSFGIVSVHAAYIRQSSPLFLASMFVLWAAAISNKSNDWSDLRAIESQLEFLARINTAESKAVTDHLTEYYRQQGILPGKENV